MKLTSRDLAREAGISIAAASHITHGRPSKAGKAAVKAAEHATGQRLAKASGKSSAQLIREALLRGEIAGTFDAIAMGTTNLHDVITDFRRDIEKQIPNIYVSTFRVPWSVGCGCPECHTWTLDRGIITMMHKRGTTQYATYTIPDNIRRVLNWRGE